MSSHCENVTAALSAISDKLKSLAKRRVLSCLTREGYLSHYDLGDEIKRHWNKHSGWRASRRQLRSKIWWLTVLQFALLIALRCVLHRYGNQDIHRWEFGFCLSLVSFLCVIKFVFAAIAVLHEAILLRQLKAWLSWIGLVLMILPQVHLRKPCYDFSFL